MKMILEKGHENTISYVGKIIQLSDCRTGENFNKYIIDKSLREFKLIMTLNGHWPTFVALRKCTTIGNNPHLFSPFLISRVGKRS